MGGNVSKNRLQGHAVRGDFCCPREPCLRLGKMFFSFRLLRILRTLRPDLMARVPAHWTINDFGVRDFAGIVAHFGVREEQKVDQLITFCVGTV